ncbi:RNA polymerase II associated protein 1 [Cichlidogyrus casuarinus]|uniref:RNA polymerase II associated protein 1 n=1 Tax=Cichlidogyrus casuarinus TaxID=1844966 RepID=A0ABD2QR41_9PLAT
MSTEEIELYREEILQSIDPKILSFFIRTEKLPCVSDQEKRRPKLNNVAQFEPDKLEWTKELPAIAKSAPNCSQARFDFQGLIVPTKLVVSTKSGLYHHGEEPERAGYSISELFHLSRSAVPAQRHIALSTLAKCLASSRYGYHAPDLTPALTALLMDTHAQSQYNHSAGGLSFLLRWCLDEAVKDVTNVGTSGGISSDLVTDCLEAFEAFLCDPMGECTFDNNFFLVLLHSNQINFSSPQSMQVDPIVCLVKQTDICKRIAWLLSLPNVYDQQQHMIHVLIPSILIRFARHSLDISYEIVKTKGLLESLAKLVPCSAQILKLFRVLAERSRSHLLTLLNDLSILRLVDLQTAEMQLESLRLLLVLSCDCEKPQKMDQYLQQQQQLFRQQSESDFLACLQTRLQPSHSTRMAQCWIHFYLLNRSQEHEHVQQFLCQCVPIYQAADSLSKLDPGLLAALLHFALATDDNRQQLALDSLLQSCPVIQAVSHFQRFVFRHML